MGINALMIKDMKTSTSFLAITASLFFATVFLLSSCRYRDVEYVPIERTQPYYMVYRDFKSVILNDIAYLNLALRLEAYLRTPDSARSEALLYYLPGCSVSENVEGILVYNSDMGDVRFSGCHLSLNEVGTQWEVYTRGQQPVVAILKCVGENEWTTGEDFAAMGERSAVAGIQEESVVHGVPDILGRTRMSPPPLYYEPYVRINGLSVVVDSWRKNTGVGTEMSLKQVPMSYLISGGGKFMLMSSYDGRDVLDYNVINPFLYTKDRELVSGEVQITTKFDPAVFEALVQSRWSTQITCGGVTERYVE